MTDNMRTEMKSWLKERQGQADWLGLRSHFEKSTSVNIRNEQRLGQDFSEDRGVMLEVLKDGFLIYVGVGQTNLPGFDYALSEALKRIEKAKGMGLTRFSKDLRPDAQGNYETSCKKPLNQVTFKDMEDFGMKLSKALHSHSDVATRMVTVWGSEVEQVLLSSSGREVFQKFSHVFLDGGAVAVRDGETQKRSLNGGLANCFQMGAEVFENTEWFEEARKAGEQAVELLAAENCPTEDLDLVLSPDQMMLQIHESIGHPLELDRILGDERNYAGWSFVQPEDFGKLQYGSQLMNVTFDPRQKHQLASYEFDESGAKAEKVYLIKGGVLKAGLGSLESQERLKVNGTANFRSSSWNRAPIDRMANINLESGSTSFEDMIGMVKRGVWMTSNRSWSIDDYRNKFQFGCEYAKLIENGKVTKTLKNPNYRGVTNQFWRSLKAVGSPETYRQYGTPFCGKGEPNQVIRVSHGSPVCLFENISVFGGGQ